MRFASVTSCCAGEQRDLADLLEVHADRVEARRRSDALGTRRPRRDAPRPTRRARRPGRGGDRRRDRARLRRRGRSVGSSPRRRAARLRAELLGDLVDDLDAARLDAPRRSPRARRSRARASGNAAKISPVVTNAALARRARAARRPSSPRRLGGCRDRLRRTLRHVRLLTLGLRPRAPSPTHPSNCSACCCTASQSPDLARVGERVEQHFSDRSHGRRRRAACSSSTRSAAGPTVFTIRRARNVSGSSSTDRLLDREPLEQSRTVAVARRRARRGSRRSPRCARTRRVRSGSTNSAASSQSATSSGSWIAQRSTSSSRRSTRTRRGASARRRRLGVASTRGGRGAPCAGPRARPRHGLAQRDRRRCRARRRASSRTGRARARSGARRRSRRRPRPARARPSSVARSAAASTPVEPELQERRGVARRACSERCGSSCHTSAGSCPAGRSATSSWIS